MSSTNKTTNYELSQYVGTDMPTYLGDYNSDMLKIDTQMKANNDLGNTADGKADTNATAIGTLANLKTTTKASTVSAINEVKDIEGFDAYDETATYNIGDYCIYNNSLYRCNTNISTAESFNNSHWTLTSIEYEFDVIKGLIAGVVESGSNTNGNYIKFADGTMICTGSKEFPSADFTTAGVGYFRDLSDTPFPQTFTAVPIANVSCSMWNTGGSIVTQVSSDKINGVRVFSTVATARAVSVFFIAIGKWK